jgi:DNA-binding CsgD family transcriptional regulator
MQLLTRAIATRDTVRSEGYLRGALIRATWRFIASPENVARVMVVATPPGVAAQLPPPPPGTVRNAPPDSESIAQLSKRELEVLALLGKGMSVPQVAEVLHRSARTVESHRLSIGKKLGVRNRSELTRFAIRAGLVTPDLPNGDGADDGKGD